MEIICSDFDNNPSENCSVTSSSKAESADFTLEQEDNISFTVNRGDVIVPLNEIFSNKKFKDVQLKNQSKNKNLNKARKNKKDEFYTQYQDAYNELKEYAHKYKGEIVYCPCDNPAWSVFVEVFKDYFHEWGLKLLVSSSYPEGIVEIYDGKNEPKQIKCENGDFRTDPLVQKTLKKCGVVVTNPPFSLFREFIKTLLGN